MHPGPFWSHFCPLHLLSHTAPCLCLMATSSLMLWSLLPGPLSSSGPNEHPCSLQVLVSKSPSPGSFQNSFPTPTALLLLDPWWGHSPQNALGWCYSPQLWVPEVTAKAKFAHLRNTPFCSTPHPTCPISFTTPSLPGAKGQGHYSKLQSWGTALGGGARRGESGYWICRTAAGLQGQVTLETRPLEWERPTHKVQGQPSGGRCGGWRC